jgi:hypothetical protein
LNFFQTHGYITNACFSNLWYLMGMHRCNQVDNQWVSVSTSKNHPTLVKVLWIIKAHEHTLRLFMVTKAFELLLDITNHRGTSSLGVMGCKRVWIVRFNQPATRNVQYGIREVKRCQDDNPRGDGSLL